MCIRDRAEVTGKSFVEVFRNEYGYLLDYVDGNMMDWSVRPNMIFTLSLIHILPAQSSSQNWLVWLNRKVSVRL